MKNIQIIDGAANEAFSIFQATDDEFELIFPLPAHDIEIVEDYVRRVGENEAAKTLAKLWERPIHKRDAQGIEGALYNDYKDRVKHLPESRRELDREPGQINHAERALYERLRAGELRD